MTSKEPSKGAIEAARRIFQDVGEVHALDIPRVAEVIDRETKAGEMAAALQKLTGLIRDCRNVYNDNSAKWLMKQASYIEAERLLTDLEVKP